MIRFIALLTALSFAPSRMGYTLPRAAATDSSLHGLATKVDTMYAKWLLSGNERNWTSQFKGPIDTLAGWII